MRSALPWVVLGAALALCLGRALLSLPEHHARLVAALEAR